MRTCAGLALSVAVCLWAPAPSGAAVYCTGDVPAYHGCTSSFATVQEALDAASSNPGGDTVKTAGERAIGAGLVYSNLGQPENALRIASGGVCNKYGCETVVLKGGNPADALFTVNGVDAVLDVEDLLLRPAAGVTGLVLPPGGHARWVSVDGGDGSVGIRAQGTADHPVVLSHATVTQPPGGLTDVAVDATGAVQIGAPIIMGDVGARSGGTGPGLEIANGRIYAGVGVTGRNARITRSLIDLGAHASAVGLEAVCPDAGAPDARISAENVTLVGGRGPGSTGVRAIGQGGDGESCGAAVDLNSTMVHGAATSFDVIGEAGSGAAPEDGAARVDAAYSNFDPATIRQTGPAQVGTGAPDTNVYGDPRLNPRSLDFGLGWDSPLIDRGDPAPVELGFESDDPRYAVVNGRRDIGRTEYQFATPSARPVVQPTNLVRVGREVYLFAGGFDADFDPLHVRWELSDGTTQEYDDLGQAPVPHVTRRYSRPGVYMEHVQVMDPTGRSADSQIEIRAARQRMLHLAVVPSRVRPPRRPIRFTVNQVRFGTTVPEWVYFRVERGVARARGRRLRWRRTPWRFRLHGHSRRDTRPFTGWIGDHRLRPGRYRLVAAPRGVRPLRTRFTIVR